MSGSSRLTPAATPSADGGWGVGGATQHPARMWAVTPLSNPATPAPHTHNFAPSPAPPIPALTSRQCGRGDPQEQGEEQRDPAESGGGRPGRWHRGRGERRASGCGAADGTGAGEKGGKEGGRRRGRRERGRGLRAGAAAESPGGRTSQPSAQPSKRASRAVPGAGGRVRRSRERRSGREKEGPGRVCAERVREGGAGGEERGAAPREPASSFGRGPARPAKFNADSPCAPASVRCLPGGGPPEPCARQARLERVPTDLQAGGGEGLSAQRTHSP